MHINPEIFRGYDIRGVWGKDLDEKIYEVLGKSYGTWLRRRRIVDAVVGCDSRESSEQAKTAFINGLSSTGVNIFDLGMVVTQMVYWGQYHLKTNGGAMITASHNPREYNGLKMAAGYSNTLVSDEVQEIRNIAQNDDFVQGKAIVTKIDIREDYFKDLLKRINIDKEFTIALDTANGTPGLYAKDLLARVGCNVIEYNTQIDGTMPLGTPDPTEVEYLNRLSKETLESKADIGLAFDTDGDRIGLVDEKGRPIWNDVIVALIAKDIIDHLPGAKIIYNTLCSKMVTEVIEQAGGNPLMWLTGHSFIKQKVAEERAPFGGELSGHFFFVDNYYGFDDGFYTVLRLLEYLSKHDKTVSETIDSLPHYISSPEIKVKSADNVKFEVIKRLTEFFKEVFSGGKYYDIDGIRVDLPDAMAIVRASQNGPYLTVKFEAKTQEKYNDIQQKLTKLLGADKDIDITNGVNNDILSHKESHD